MPARVRDEQVLAAVVRVVPGGDSHSRVGIGEPFRAAALDQAEAEATRVGRRPARPRLVEVEPVRVEVVRDVEVEPAVPVRVREGRAETVVEPGRLEPRGAADLAESRMRAGFLLVEEEAIAVAAVVGGEADSEPGRGWLTSV